MPHSSPLISANELGRVVNDVVQATPVVDLHTHLYTPAFGTPSAGTGRDPADPSGLLLWGLDELLTYHYLIAEVFRVVPPSKLPYEQFWKMSKTEQADHIWKQLFIDRSPVSEACRGVLTALQQLGIDTSDRNLGGWRKHFAQQDPSKQIDRCMEAANIQTLVMTNPVFDDNERNRWLKNPNVGDDPRFRAVLRIDPLLRDWPGAAGKMAGWGYGVSAEISAKVIDEARRFLRDWIDRQKAIYLAVSLPPDWTYPAPPHDPVARAGQTMLEQAVLPVCAERGLPFAMMIGSRLKVNPSLRDAGDMVGKADISSLTNVLSAFPQNKFLVTMLSRDNQHELCVAARKFGNLMVFGCWWFLNNPSLVDEITRMRLELLGTSFVPQHSDARVLEQIVYKWHHSKQNIAAALTDKYADLLATGWTLTRAEIERDVRDLLSENFLRFLKA
jgi:hypothetical protein